MPATTLRIASVTEVSSSILEARTSSNSALTVPSPENPVTLPSLQLQDLQLAGNPFYSYLLGDLSVSSIQMTQLLDSLGQGSLLACSDGSYDPITNTAAYGMVFGTEQTPLLRSSGPCPGHPDHRSAIRSELTGLAASTFLLLSICKSGKLQNGSVTLYNDSTKAQKLFNHPGRKFKRFLVQDYDLITEIPNNVVIIRTYIAFNLVWVKGHYKGKHRNIEHDFRLCPNKFLKYEVPSNSLS